MFIAQQQRYPRLSKAVAMGLLLNWLLLTLDIPLPFWLAKDRSRPFPCMDSVCGCHSAEKCWRSCCCFTNQQKLAWAKRNKITPPAFVIAAAKREQTSSSLPSSCCLSKSDSCHAQETNPSASAKGGHPTIAKQPANNSCDSNDSSKLDIVVLSSARRCQGGDMVTHSSELVTILLEVESTDATQLPSDWVKLVDLRPADCELSPLLPPPKIG